MKSLKFMSSILFAMLFAFASCTNVDEPDKKDDDDDDDPKVELTTLLSENFGADVTTTAPAEGWTKLADYTDFKKEGKGGAAVEYKAYGGIISLRGNLPSKDYEDASAGANAFMPAAGGVSLVVKNIAVCGAKAISISFGSSTTSSVLSVDYRVAGSADWQTLGFTKTTDNWGLVEIEKINLPAGTNTITLRFNATKSEFGARIDDLKIVTEDAVGNAVVDTDNIDDSPTDNGGGDGNGDGSQAKPYSVADAIANQNESVKWVKGYIVGSVKNDDAISKIESNNDVVFGVTNVRATVVLLADSPTETNYANCVAVNLPTGDIRKAVNLVDNAGNLGKWLKVEGKLRTYFSIAGVRDLVGFELEGGSGGGEEPGDGILNETLLTQASFSKFTAVSVKGDQVWNHSAQYGAMMSGFADSRSYENEDWFISPVMNLAGKSNVKLSFDHARGPAAEITTGVNEGWYTVWVTNDYNSGNPNEVTWTELTGVIHGTAGWVFVSSGELTIPTANLKANARFAFKYLCSNEKSATWEVKNVVVK